MQKIQLSVILLISIVSLGLVSCGENLQRPKQTPGSVLALQSMENLDKALFSADKKLAEFAGEANIEQVQLSEDLKAQDLIAKTQEIIIELAQLQANGIEPVQIPAGAQAATVVYDLKTIPDRIKLGLKIIEAIVQGSTELGNKKQAAINAFAFKISAAIIDLANPLSDTKAMFNNLENAINQVVSSPNQTDDDYANMHSKQKLANLLIKYRAYKFNETKEASKEVNKKLDEIILLATGVRLNPFATLAEVKHTMQQVNTAAQKALNNEMPVDFVKFEGSVLTADKAKEYFENLKTDIKTGIAQGTALKNLMDMFKDAQVLGTTEKPTFDISLLKPRLDILLKVGEAIKLGTNEYRYKEQSAHTKVGFAATYALIDVFNPFATADVLTTSLANITQALIDLENAAELTDDSIANVNVKEAMAKQLREYRTYQFKEFKDKPYKAVKSFNDAILAATGVRLDPAASVKQVKDTLQSLKTQAETIENLADATADEKLASWGKKRELFKAINKAFFADKSQFSQEEKQTAKQVILDARKVHLNIHATVGEVNASLESLQKYIK